MPGIISLIFDADKIDLSGTIIRQEGSCVSVYWLNDGARTTTQ